jgi:hypothetical protein
MVAQVEQVTHTQVFQVLLLVDLAVQVAVALCITIQIVVLVLNMAEVLELQGKEITA